MDTEDMSNWGREQLLRELKRATDDKKQLAETNKRHELEIERLKRELANTRTTTTGDINSASANAQQLNCDQTRETNNNNNNSNNNSGQQLELEQALKRCKMLEEERDKLRDEIKMLEGEVDELQDNFREEENEQFEQTKQELDISMKNCKILQIRLNKSERQYAQLEQVKQMLEQQLEGQLTTAANESTNNNPLGSPSSQPANFIQLGKECVKLPTSDYDQLLRDLSDTIEREKDLQEQIKYSQEEAQLKSDRLQVVEAENETLLGQLQKCTQTNARLRLQLAGGNSKDKPPSSMGEPSNISVASSRELIEQNEQMKLALDLCQSECTNLKSRCQELASQLATRDCQLAEFEAKRSQLENDLVRLRASMLRRANALDCSPEFNNFEEEQREQQLSRLELECRQLRSKLIQSERDNKQLKQRLANTNLASQHAQHQDDLAQAADRSSSRHAEPYGCPASPSMARSGSIDELARQREVNRQLRDECSSLRLRSEELEKQLARLLEEPPANRAATNMESDLVDKMRRQLDASESELARARSRLVELDIELKRVQRLYKRQVDALESRSEVVLSRSVKLPPEAQRDSMSRQELRSALSELEQQLEECKTIISALKGRKASDQTNKNNNNGEESGQPAVVGATGGPELAGGGSQDGLKASLEHERQMTRKLRNQLEQLGHDLETKMRFHERERASIDEEMEKLRNLNQELRNELDESAKSGRSSATKLRDLQTTCEKLRKDLQLASESRGQGELAQQRKQQQLAAMKLAARDAASERQPPATGGDALLLARDLAELKVKNGFLMHELELARADNLRKLNELRQANEAQTKRSLEMSQLELKETHLVELQKIRDELSDSKQKLANSQRQLIRSEEEVASERDKLRAAERDWRRERGQLMQRLEQLEAQIGLERRANDFKVKECESAIRDKERELISVQDKCVQLERDLKRAQNKYQILEENSESKIKKLIAELELKKRDYSELIGQGRKRDEEYYDTCRRFNSEKATLSEALDTIRRSHDEKFAELKSVRELLALRQEQIYKERSSHQAKLDELSRQLIRMSDFESQAKLLKHQFQVQEKQADCCKRELLQLKEDKQKFKTKCEKLEARCQQLEKQELLNKTSSISSTSARSRSPFGIVGSKLIERQPRQQQQQQEPPVASSNSQQQQHQQLQQQLDAAGDSSTTIDKLSSKINDQRQMMNLLKRQLGELQLELKQAKLLHSCERLKWQSQLAELTSRLNESEERLLFETSLVGTGSDLLDCGRKRCELKWADERRALQQLISQQQAQNELLTRDLKRTIQAHDLLRMENKQIEAHNGKLSRKVIDYQQQLSMLPQEKEQTRSLARELELENQRLYNLLQEQVRPIVESVNKILQAIENNPTDGAGSKAAATGDTSLVDNRQQAEPTPSIKRPLITKTVTRRQSSIESDDSSRPDAPLVIKSAWPAHQVNATTGQQQSRFSRLISSASSSAKKHQQAASDSGLAETSSPFSASSHSKPASGGVKTVRKVRLRSLSLGLSLSEKKQLKQRLNQISEALGDLEDLRPASFATGASSSSSTAAAGEREQRRVNWQLEQSRNSGYWSETPTSQQQAATGSTSGQLLAVRGLASHRLSYDGGYRTDATGGFGANSSNRWQQQQHGYESESSIASDVSSSIPSNRARFTSGAESDSCIAADSMLSPRKPIKSSRGIKGRLTSTIRNLSRSLVGLTSDSESEQPANTSSTIVKKSSLIKEVRV